MARPLNFTESEMNNFFDKVRILQWDNHRYYHQSRINQTIHLISAMSFLAAYLLLFVDPAAAGIVGWLIGTVMRQSGHIFFEPRCFDEINGVSDSYKESIKVGYNTRLKAILIGLGFSLPMVLFVSPTLLGLIEPAQSVAAYWHNVGLAWLALGVCGVYYRTLHLFALRGASWGLAWAIKIILDPFHNIAIYWRSPLALMHGEMLDPITTDSLN